VFLQRAARHTGGSDLGVQVTKAMHGEAVTGEIDEIDLAQVHSEIMQETGSPGRSSILCLCGQIDFDVDGQSYCLEPGDNLTFNSDAYHRLRNTSSTPGTAVLVLRPHVPYIPVSED
jgi:quercetin dioxygenase-like cupin family protein